MLTIRSGNDQKVVEWIIAHDPFQFAPPLHVYRPVLPSEYRRISIEESNQFMAIRVMPVSEAPVRSRGSRMASNTDFNAVLDAVKNPAHKGKAIVVQMEDPMWTQHKDGKLVYDKPEVSFAYTLRRWFATQHLAVTAYQSGKMEITVRAMTAAEVGSATRAKRK